MTAYEMRMSDWSSDVCSSDLASQKTEIRQPPGQGPVELTFGLECGNGRRDFATQVLRHAIAQRSLFMGQFLIIATHRGQIGRASCRERVYQSVESLVVAVSFKTSVS